MRQIRRNGKLVAMLVIPPTLNLVLLGFAMNPEVTNLRLGLVDESQTSGLPEPVDVDRVHDRVDGFEHVAFSETTQLTGWANVINLRR